jgi:hypothetical protein
MIDLDAALDELTTGLGEAMGLSSTRDPAAIVPPCVFVGLPRIAGRTLGATQLEVPVSIVSAGNGDLTAGRWLLDNVQELLELTGTREATPRPISVGSADFPAYQVQATVNIRSTE